MQLIRSESGIGEYLLTTEEQEHFSIIRDMVDRGNLGYCGRRYDPDRKELLESVDAVLPGLHIGKMQEAITARAYQSKYLDGLGEKYVGISLQEHVLGSKRGLYPSLYFSRSADELYATIEIHNICMEEIDDVAAILMKRERLLPPVELKTVHPSIHGARYGFANIDRYSAVKSTYAVAQKLLENMNIPAHVLGVPDCGSEIINLVVNRDRNMGRDISFFDLRQLRRDACKNKNPLVRKQSLEAYVALLQHLVREPSQE